jgi:parvulin-like peptidyl-prolyl isomerase
MRENQLDVQKKISKIIAYVYFFLFIATVSFASEKYDPQHTMLALNMAIVSVHRITSSKDRVSLTNEYNNIINNLAIGNIESDPDITALYEELLDVISNKTIREEESQRLQKKYTRKEQRRLYDSLKKIKSDGGDIKSWIASLFLSCITQYFEYQNYGEELKDELDDNSWLLTKEDLKSCNSIQKKLLTSSWNLLRKYRLPDRFRLEQDSLNEFFNTLNNRDSHQKLRILKRIEKDFQVYPPYWIYRAKTAQELKDKEEAKKCYDKFDEVWRPVLRKDPFKQEAVKYRISELTDKININKDKIKELLEVLEGNSKYGEWFNNVFAGIVYYAISEKNKAIDCVQSNLDSDYEKEVSQVLYDAFKNDNVDVKSLGEKIGLSINYATEVTNSHLLKKDITDDKNLLAEVLDVKITREIFDKQIDSFRKVGPAEAITKISTLEGKQDFLRQLVEVTMFQKKAQLEKLDKADSFKAEVHKAAVVVLSMEHMKKLLEGKKEQEQIDAFKTEIERLKKVYNFSLDKKVAETVRKDSLTEAELNAVVAKYDGKEIKVSEIYKDLEQIPTFIRPQILGGEGLNDFLDQHFARVLSLLDAEKNFDAYSKENPGVIADVTRRTLVKSLFDKVLNPVTVSDAEVKEFYNKNLSNFASPASMHAHHILVKEEAEAKKIMETLTKEPAKFEEIAKTSSTCPSGAQGGDLGTFSEGQMVPEFENACKTAELNKVIGPVKTQFGYHIIRVDGRTPAGTMKFEDVQDNIRKQLLPQKQKEVFDAYVETLRKEFNVKVYQDNL